MGNLRPESIDKRLKTFLQALGRRAWSGPFNQQDIGAVLGCGRRFAQSVASEGTHRGLFTPNSYGYSLTTTGQGLVSAEKGVPRASGSRHLTDLEEKKERQALTSVVMPKALPRESRSLHELHVEADQEIKQISYSKSHARARSKLRAKGKLALKKELALAAIKNGKVGSPEHAKALYVMGVFESLVQVYTRKPYVRVFKNGLTPQARGKFNAVTRMADELNMDCATFVRAQFWWFDKCFSRHPKPHEIATAKAKERAAQYRLDINAGLANAVTEPSTREMTLPKTPQHVKDAFSENALRTMMHNWHQSAEQIFKAVAGGPNKYDYFDRVWLRNHPVYQQLKAAGDV